MKPNKEMQQIQQKIANVKRQLKVEIPRKEFVHEEFEFDGASLGDVTEWYESLDFDSYGFFGQVYWKRPEREDAYQARKADINRWLTSQLRTLEAELHDIATKQAQSVSAKKEQISKDIEEYNLYLKLKEKFEGLIMCADGWDGSRNPVVGECPECGADIDKDGDSVDCGCYYSTSVCPECGDAPCDESC